MGVLESAAIGNVDEAELRTLMGEAGIAGEPADFLALLDGINAAPDNPDWLQLVAPNASAAIADRLSALRRARAGQPSNASPPRDARLAALRARLREGGLAGFVVPRADEHQGEYVPACAERLAWLTGFTGSAGTAVVLRDQAALFVDGRYTIQAPAQVDGASFQIEHLVDSPLSEWAAARLNKDDRLGYDPWLHTADWVEKTAESLGRKGVTLVAVSPNPIDEIWIEQPPPPLSPVVAHAIEFAGQSADEKGAQIGESLRMQGAVAAVLSAPDSIAWLYNIRGGDVPRTPLPLSFAIVHADGRSDLFVDGRKVTSCLRTHLGDRVSVRQPSEFGDALDELSQGGGAVLADPSTAAAWIFERLGRSGVQVLRGADPCALPKACKNGTELDGVRAAHRRDGAALCRFLHWLDREIGRADLTEVAAAEVLHDLRAGHEFFRDLSFDTISAAGPNSAIPHYRVTEESNRPLEAGSLYLVDSGAQYPDGTTDVTRTIAVGTPTAEMRTRFTLVLKGHIALATARFPSGTTGSQIDVLARQYLWQAGLDFDHGTGHGVGCYLSVHEGPQRISKLPNAAALRPGMIVSNEPGYYKAGAYGIRIENLQAVRPAELMSGAERPMLGFEILTLAPIDRSLIDVDLLTPAEVAWVDAYHARVLSEIGPQLDDGDRVWLKDATRTLGAGA